MTTGVRAREDRQCSDCACARIIPGVRRRGMPMVRCIEKHWRREHTMDELPEDIAQMCADYDDMDYDPGGM